MAMRVALIADIHGNLVSLDAVLTVLGRERVDQIVCLGDVAATGPQPHAVLTRLRELGCPIIMGNADAWLLDPADRPPPASDDLRRIEEIDRWCLAQLRGADLDFVRTFQPTVPVPLGSGALLLCMHGSPRSNMDAIRATTPDGELDAMLTGVAAAVVAGGHTHTQLLRRHGDLFIVNPGSVGLPYERLRSSGRVRNPPWAEYGVVEWQEEQLSLQLRHTPVDVGAVVDAAEASGMPHGAWWIGGWS